MVQFPTSESTLSAVDTVVQTPPSAAAVQPFSERQTTERLLIDIYTTFAYLSGDRLAAEIERVLQQLVGFLGLDCGSFGEFIEKGTLLISCSVASGGAKAVPRGPFPAELTWYLSELRAGRPVILQRLPDDLPSTAVSEREYCQRTGTHSHLAIPLYVGGRVFGAIGFAALHGPRVWPSDLIARLKLIGEAFAQPWARSRSETERAAAQAELAQLRQYAVNGNTAQGEAVRGDQPELGLTSCSPRFNRILDELQLVAPTAASVLLTGETGTGKEVLADAIHRLSRRNRRPMIKINCAALPATLVEAELFGREKGAYTGSLSAQPGRFALADGATIFLDEIGDLPLELQPKLLRVLQTGEYERLGSSETRQVDVRVIAATNRDLLDDVKQGRFRSDLYYRLGVFPIEVPPLRERREDIPLLINCLVARKSRQLGKTISTIPSEVITQLSAYDWPGNVRELENVIERAIILAPTGELIMRALPHGTEHKASDIASRPVTAAAEPELLTLAELERAHIMRVCTSCGWRIKGPGGAAAMLGLPPGTLYFRMKKLGISRPG